MRLLNCYVCKERKTEDLFHTDKTRHSGRSSRCKACTEVSRRVRRGMVLNEMKNLRLAYLETGCVVCGEKDPVVLDLHHIDPAQKDVTVSQLFRTGKKRDLRKLPEEMGKCVVVCANCHRRVHARTAQLPDPRPFR